MSAARPRAGARAGIGARTRLERRVERALVLVDRLDVCREPRLRHRGLCERGRTAEGRSRATRATRRRWRACGWRVRRRRRAGGGRRGGRRPARGGSGPESCFGRSGVCVLLALVGEECRLEALDLLVVPSLSARRRRSGRGRCCVGARLRRSGARARGRGRARRARGLARLVLRERELRRRKGGLCRHHVGLELSRVEGGHDLADADLLTDGHVDGTDRSRHVEAQVGLVDRRDRRHRVERRHRGARPDDGAPVEGTRTPCEHDGEDHPRGDNEDHCDTERRDPGEPCRPRRKPLCGALDRWPGREPSRKGRIAHVGRQLARRVRHRS